jgi:chemosensory pili system protein ChpA (sensor histidine kinase/response regulator)
VRSDRHRRRHRRVDAVDAELFPIFEEEGSELLPKLATGCASGAHPASRQHRAVHAHAAHLEGRARLPGDAPGRNGAPARDPHRAAAGAVDPSAPPTSMRCKAESDALSAHFEMLRSRDEQAYAQASRRTDRGSAGAVREPPHSRPAARARSEAAAEPGHGTKSRAAPRDASPAPPPRAG